MQKRWSEKEVKFLTICEKQQWTLQEVISELNRTKNSIIVKSNRFVF